MSYIMEDNVDLIVSCSSDDDDIGEYYLEEIVDSQEADEVIIGESDDDEVEIVEPSEGAESEANNGDENSESKVNLSSFAFEMF